MIRPVLFRPRGWAASLALVFALACLLTPLTGQAHPFGSSYFAQQTTIKLEPKRVQVEYLIEVPTSVIMQEFYVALQGREPSKDEDARFTKEKLKVLSSGLTLLIDGQPVALRDLTDPGKRNGVGNMNFFVYRMSAEADWAPEVGSSHRLQLQNKNYAVGGTYFSQQVWASDALSVKKSSSWGQSSGVAATDYAGQWFNNVAMRDVDLEVQVNAAAGGPPAPVMEPVKVVEASAGQGSSSASPGGGLEIEDMPLIGYLGKTGMSWWEMAAVLGLALFLGAGHALTPGHGKTLVAAYLVGSRHTIRHALMLGLAVTVSHTAGVFLLGVVTLFAERFVKSETLYTILGVGSGLTIVWIGLWLIRDRWRQRNKGLMDRYELGRNLEGGGDGRGQDGRTDTEAHDHDYVHYDDEGRAGALVFAPVRSSSQSAGHVHSPGPLSGRGPVASRGLSASSVGRDAHSHSHDGPGHAHDSHSHAHDTHARDGHAHAPASSIRAGARHSHSEGSHSGHSHSHDSHGNGGHTHGSHGNGGHAHDSHGNGGHTHDSHGHSGHSHDSHGNGGHAHDSHGNGSHSHDSHGHSGHSHDSHGHGRFHSHWGADADHVHALPEDGSVAEIIKLGIAGGIVPCPGATVVLLVAIAKHQVGFGLALVLAYSIGLAAVLVTIGVALVLGGKFIQRFTGDGRVLRYMPIASAVLVTLIGVAITISAWRGAGPLAGAIF